MTDFPGKQNVTTPLVTATCGDLHIVTYSLLLHITVLQKFSYIYVKSVATSTAT